MDVEPASFLFASAAIFFQTTAGAGAQIHVGAFAATFFDDLKRAAHALLVSWVIPLLPNVVGPFFLSCERPDFTVRHVIRREPVKKVHVAGFVSGAEHVCVVVRHRFIFVCPRGPHVIADLRTGLFCLLDAIADLRSGLFGLLFRLRLCLGLTIEKSSTNTHFASNFFLANQHLVSAFENFSALKARNCGLE